MLYLVLLITTISSVGSTRYSFHHSPVHKFGFLSNVYSNFRTIYEQRSFGNDVSCSTMTTETTKQPLKRKILRVTPFQDDLSKFSENNITYKKQCFLKEDIPLPPSLPKEQAQGDPKQKKETLPSTIFFTQKVAVKDEKKRQKKAPKSPVFVPLLSPPPMPKKSEHMGEFIHLHPKMFVVPPPPKTDYLHKKREKGYFCKKEEETLKQIVANSCSVTEVEEVLFDENDIDISFYFLKNIVFLSMKTFFQIFARYVVIDTEATGLGNGHKLTEIGCVVVEGMQITGEQFHSLIDPQRHVGPAAHRLTGYTLQFLSDYPTFDKIAPFFRRFVGSSPLVFHNAHFDLKLIHEGFKAAGIDIKYENTHTIIDTLTLARKNAAEKKIERKNNLTELCDYFGIKTSARYKHGARIDALLTAQAFLKLIREKKENFLKYSDWNEMPRFNLFERFSKINETKGIKIFKKFGIKSPLPENFLYSESLYHEQLDDFFPAIIIPFYHKKKDYEGCLVKYDIAHPILEYHPEYKKGVVLKHFYGKAQNTYSRIFGYGEKTLFIGRIIHALLVRDVLQEDDLLSILNINEKEYEIRGVFDTVCFESLYIPEETRQIFLLIDYFEKEKCIVKKTLSRVIERFCHTQFLSFYSVILKEKDLLEWQIKYKQENWIVRQDDMKKDKRIIEIENSFLKRLIIDFNADKKMVFVGEERITDPNTEILFSKPKIRVRCVTLRTKESKNATSHFTEEIVIRNTAEALKSALELKNFKDLVFIEKIDQALKLYNESFPITNDCVVQKYCDARGFHFPLPKDFRYREKDYHPWLEGAYPALIVPLYNKTNKIAGIHRIFFHPNGEPLPKKSTTGTKIPIKLSLGKTVACANEIYKESILKYKVPTEEDQAELVMLSEGFENGLIVKDTFEYLSKTDPVYTHKIHTHFGIKDTFCIKGCIGINGLIDVPLYEKTQTVVLLADNDGDNEAAKATIRQTIEKFLSFNKKVYLVFPEGQSGEKLDINDVFLRDKENPFYKVGELLLKSIRILRVEDLGADSQSLQETFLKIRNCDMNAYQTISPSDITVESKSSSTCSKKQKKPFIDIPISIDEEEASEKQLSYFSEETIQDLDFLSIAIDKEADYFERKRYHH